MKLLYANGLQSVILRVKIRDATSILDAGLTSLSTASTGLVISTIADVEATMTRYRQADSNIETITTLGTYATPTTGKCRFKEVDATNHPGLYEIQLDNARFAVAGARSLVVTITGPAALNICQEDYEIQLSTVNLYDAVRAGLTALPNAAAEAAGGLYTRGSLAGQINQTTAGRIDTDVKSLSGVGAVADIANDAAGRATFLGMFRALYNRFYNKVEQTDNPNGDRKVYNDSDVLVSTMVTSDNGTIQTKGKSS